MCVCGTRQIKITETNKNVAYLNRNGKISNISFGKTKTKNHLKNPYFLVGKHFNMTDK